jgi:hypothetical protein
MNTSLFNKLHKQGLLSDTSLEKVNRRSVDQLFSLHWEIRVILYLGIFLLAGGLGILVYKNIDSIGHQFILFFIALICAGSFFYCFKKKLPFSNGRVMAPDAFFDYILLLACLMFITFIAYFQYQYNVFGNRYGLASFFPMLVLFLSAYYFDHLGILSLAITNLAAWLGITVTPLQLLKANDFNNEGIIFTGILLGVLLVVAGTLSAQKRLKAHFAFTYTNFGMHLLFISLLAAMFHFERIYLIWFLCMVATAYYFYAKSKKDRSFYILMISTLYTYIGLSYVVIQLLTNMGGFGMATIYLGFLYFIASGIMLVIFLMRTNKIVKANAGI